MLWIVKRTAPDGSVSVMDSDADAFIPIERLTDGEGDFGEVEFGRVHAESIIDPAQSPWAKADLDAGYRYELVQSDDDFWAPEG